MCPSVHNLLTVTPVQHLTIHFQGRTRTRHFKTFYPEDLDVLVVTVPSGVVFPGNSKPVPAHELQSSVLTGLHLRQQPGGKRRFVGATGQRQRSWLEDGISHTHARAHTQRRRNGTEGAPVNPYPVLCAYPLTFASQRSVGGR